MDVAFIEARDLSEAWFQCVCKTLTDQSGKEQYWKTDSDVHEKFLHVSSTSQELHDPWIQDKWAELLIRIHEFNNGKMTDR